MSDVKDDSRTALRELVELQRQANTQADNAVRAILPILHEQNAVLKKIAMGVTLLVVVMCILLAVVFFLGTSVISSLGNVTP